MEKGWKQKFNEIHDKIVDGHKRGVCNKNGESVNRKEGGYAPKPRVLGHVTFYKKYPKSNAMFTWLY